MDSWPPRQQRVQRPPYPQFPAQSSTTSTVSSVFQSSTSLATVSSAGATSPAASLPPAMSSHSAPLPSPSAGQPSAYFSPTSVPTSNASQQNQQSLQRPAQPQTAMQQAHIGQRGGGGGLPETASFLQDFNLIAEAAKRAEMACLARDLGDVGL